MARCGESAREVAAALLAKAPGRRSPHRELALTRPEAVYAAWLVRVPVRRASIRAQADAGPSSPNAWPAA